MQRKWLVRPYQEGDEHGILRLRKEVYPELEYDHERWLRWWRWTFKENPMGHGWIAVAEFEGRIIGQQAAIPLPIKIGTKVTTCFQAVQAMTHPAFRGHGIFRACHAAMLSQTEEDCVYTGFTFANNLSHPILVRKLSYFDVARTPYLFKILNWRNALKRKISNRLLLAVLDASGILVSRICCREKDSPNVEGLTLCRITHFDERINAFWNRVSYQYPIMLIRNKDYLNWRYVTIPEIDYTIYTAEKDEEISGYLVLRCMEIGQRKEGVIFDVLAQSEEVAHSLISRSVEHCKQKGLDVISSCTLANKTHLRSFRNNGFISIPLKRFDWLIARSSSNDVSYELMVDVKNWFVQLGDSDVL